MSEDRAVTLSGLRVALVAGTLGQGGAERQLFYVLKVLTSAGASPMLWCLTQGEFWEARIAELGVPISFVGCTANRLSRSLAMIRTARATRPDFVQSFHFYTNLYAAVAARSIGVPAIGALRSDGANELRGIGPMMSRWSLTAPNVIASNSPAAVDSVKAGGCRTPLFLLRNVIDLSQFVWDQHVPAAGIRVTAIGRLGPEKRFDRLLRILAEVRRLHGSVEARIVGGGTQAEALVRAARSLDLTDSVVFTGPVEDVRPHLRWSSCVVLTSDYEGTPNVLLEAMAVGRPIVAARVGGVPNLIADRETGYLLDPTDEPGFARAIVDAHMNTHAAQQIVAAARRYVERMHSLSGLERSLIDLYSHTS